MSAYVGAEILCSDLENRALKAMLQFARQNSPQISQTDLLKKVAAVVLPDVSSLSWSEIIGIKREVRSSDLREQLTNVFAEEGEPQAAVERFSREAKQLNRKIILNSRPRAIRALVEMVTTNLPIGLFNPFSIFSGYRNCITQCHEEASRNWIYALNELEERVEANQLPTLKVWDQGGNRDPRLLSTWRPEDRPGRDQEKTVGIGVLRTVTTSAPYWYHPA